MTDSIPNKPLKKGSLVLSIKKIILKVSRR